MIFTKRVTAGMVLALALVVGGGQPAGGSVNWQAAPGYRWAELQVAPGQKSGFTMLPAEQTAIRFTNAVDELATAANRVLLNGAGLAAGDFDGDGLVDVFFCSLTGRNALYRNLGGWKFQDVTEAAGVALTNQVSRGAVFADVNGDRRLDLLITTLNNGVICFMNTGTGAFTNATAWARTQNPFGSTTLALADVDGNGTLDLYVANYRGEDIRDRGQVDLQMVKGRMVVPPKLRHRLLVVDGRVLEYGDPDILLLNDGQGRFTPVSWTDGAFLDEDGQKLTELLLDWGLTASFRDLNGDGWPDLYVCNDYWTPDRIWINQGQGQFRAIPRLALRQISSSSMGVDMADIDRDGHVDVMVTDMLSRDPRLRKRQMPAVWPIPAPVREIEFRPQIIQNTLFHSRGDGTFAEIANYAGVAASDWTWQPLFMDVDLDGYPDLLVAAGHARDVQDLDAGREIQARQRSWRGFTNAVERQKAFTHELMVHMRLYPTLAMPIFAFRNRGNLQFEEMTAPWGTSHPGVHHAIAVADFDNDGDLDLMVNNFRAVAGVYRNETAAPRVAVRLRGRPPNTEGIGAKIQLLHGPVPHQTEEIISGGRYMSGSQAMAVFAAGSGQTNLVLEVQWPRGGVSRVPGVTANRIYEIDEPVAAPAKPVVNRSASGDGGPGAGEPLFREIGGLISHRHHDESFDDFERQPLLPRKLSQLGPGVAWFDLNGDGWDDLVIGGGRGGQMAVFMNDSNGGFRPWLEAPVNSPVTRDQTAIVGVINAEGQAALLAGSSNYEDGLAAGPGVRQFDLSNKRINDSLPGQPSSTGPVALADIDADGDLDLFIGGRVVPGRYPEPASSLILRASGGRWETDAANTRAVRNAGLVSGAVWSDLNADGYPELILACEWGPVRVFRNEAGTLRDATAELGLDKHKGWWTGVTTGDLDGDGRLDIVAGNWGLNSDYPVNPKRPFRLFYGDIAQRGMVDLLEAEYDLLLNDFAPRRRLDALAPSMPFLLARFGAFKAFSEASVTTVLGPKPPGVQFLEINTLASTAFLNRGSHFEPVQLPREAQFAPAFAVCVADFDGDGHEDVFLSQNFFGNEPDTPRLDAGRGLLLLGDGTGQLHAMSARRSGIEVYGEQRGAAVADYDRDGRADLVVTQNAAATRLFHNQTAKPGLRVRLIGPAGNPSGIGATIRLRFGERPGPVRELHAGSGYWSQDSAVQVLGTPEMPTALWVRWPGGKVTTIPITGEPREVSASMN